MFTRTLIILATTLALSGCLGSDSNTAPVANGPAFSVGADGTSSFNSANLDTTLATLPLETLTSAEQDSLAYIREEEKLARDVYRHLGTTWGPYINTFGNIANSEATHTEAVRQLLLRYQLTDPAAGQADGAFTDTTLQGLYTQLIQSGDLSLADALKVGVTIEELDIVDIRHALDSIDNQDIILVYNNLLKGSRNHLRAFNRALGQQGISYTPQYLTQAEYDAILAGGTEF